MRKFEYPYKKIMNEGKERYLVKLPDGSSWIEVSPDVFHTLCTSSWKDDKKTQRYHKKIVPFEYDSSDNSHIVQSENRFLALQCKSAEDTFIENELRQEFWRILRENCTDSELQMIHALFLRMLQSRRMPTV